jgi:hypothetical protein
MAKGTAALIVVLGLFSSGDAWSQAADSLPDYVPLLPAVKAKALAVDPQKGYLVKELKPGIYMITDGAYESVFATTGKGVVLFDAPPSFAQHIVNAVSEATKEPIIELEYTHVHVDHIGERALSSRASRVCKSWRRAAQPNSCARCMIRTGPYLHARLRIMKP